LVAVSVKPGVFTSIAVEHAESKINISIKPDKVRLIKEKFSPSVYYKTKKEPLLF